MSRFMHRFIANHQRTEVRGPDGQLCGVIYRPKATQSEPRGTIASRLWLTSAVLISIVVIPWWF